MPKADSVPNRRFVVWGLSRRWHSHRYIHSHFFHAIRRMGCDVVWCNDDLKNADAVDDRSIVISANVCSKYLPIRKGALYVAHNFIESVEENVRPDHFIRLQVYTDDVKRVSTARRLMSATYFDVPSRTLYQPWGTNLPPDRFMPPVSPETRSRKNAFWVGAIWRNEQGQGNIDEIATYKATLRGIDKRFVHLRFVPDAMNCAAIRLSTLAPAIAGGWQATVNYLPCRMFKNISYGHLGASNVTGFDEVFGDAALLHADIPSLVGKCLSMPKREFTERIMEQQSSLVAHTYEQKIRNIISVLC